MTEAFKYILEFLRQVFLWWFSVQPWEMAVRVRAGKHVKLCSPGFHLKIPIVDAIYVHNTRRSVMTVPAVTLSSKDGRVFVASCSVSFVIQDVLKLHTSVNYLDGVLRQRICQVMAEFFLSTSGDAVNPAELQKALTKVNTEDLGVGELQISIANFSSVSTFRMIQDSLYNTYGSSDNSYVSTTTKL